MIDPTFELLWRQIAEAYQQVANDAGRGIEIEHDKYRVSVYQLDAGPVQITVWDDVEVKPPTLIAP
jgi:hypothetical protein